MSQQIKKIWFRIAAFSLGLYFAPIGHLILSLFGVRTNAGRAYAGTIICSGNGTASWECGGKSGTYVNSDVVQCTCETDASKIYDVQCSGGDRSGWDHETTYAVWEVRTGCYYPDSCSPNGSTQDCSNSKQYCTKTCTNGRWGPAVWGNCKSGYIKINNSCLAECSVLNGKGYESTEYDSSSSSSS
ncbi:MAG: hypothetical protein K2I81_01515 [Alphaproteobacteria bacterium]|nr:hypothetical protein [Alphaproteobacteria bacterium]